MDRREFLKLGAVFVASAVLGGIGGITAKEDGRWGEPEESPDDEPPH